MEDIIRKRIVELLTAEGIRECDIRILFNINNYDNSTMYKIIVLYDGSFNEYVESILRVIKFDAKECYYNDVGKCLVILCEGVETKKCAKTLQECKKEIASIVSPAYDCIIRSYIQRGMEYEAIRVYNRTMYSSAFL